MRAICSCPFNSLTACRLLRGPRLAPFSLRQAGFDLFCTRMLTPADLFDLAETEHGAIFAGCEFAWEALAKLSSYVEALARSDLRNRCEGRAFIGEHVSIGEDTVVEDGAMIKGPAMIGRRCQIRHNAYIREGVIVGDDCVVGNACELKNAVLFNGCQVPHFNYVGDSILGYKAHLGAGVILSNYKLVAGNVVVVCDGRSIDSGLRKFGALLGDHAEIGCNSVLNPGSVIGRRSVVYPNVSWRGVLPPETIVKNKGASELVLRHKRSTESR
jgi:UDP-N-acetylglucosamine diphosphorylase / glucose-1-phosphate thymidylyltransferase / UDP-N-acetylgalactosamine diphosphorylase / glucosamine-1-phosphate N-acetyltransferase / galactosamine-1-phosphate N-acetyltransferase